MVSPLVVVNSVLPVFILMIVGALARRVGLIRRDEDDAIMRFTIHILFPAFILDKLLGNHLVGDFSVLGWGMSLAVVLIVSGIAGAWLAGGLLGLGRGTGRRTFSLAAGVQNWGYTAIPVLAVLWPGDDGVIGVLFVHNLGVEITVWSVGVWVMTGGGGLQWRKLINGPAVAIVLGLFLVLTGLDRFFESGPHRVALHWMGMGAFPIGIFITGAIMMDLVTAERPSPRIALGGIVVRLFLLPLLFLAAAKWLPIIVELKRVLVVQAAMPAALTPVLIAKLYDGRPAVAVQIVIATTLACILTLPLVIYLAMNWIPL